MSTCLLTYSLLTKTRERGQRSQRQQTFMEEFLGKSFCDATDLLTHTDRKTNSHFYKMCLKTDILIFTSAQLEPGCHGPDQLSSQAVAQITADIHTLQSLCMLQTFHKLKRQYLNMFGAGWNLCVTTVWWSLCVTCKDSGVGHRPCRASRTQ